MSAAPAPFRPWLGANAAGGGRTRFRLWAPSLAAVTLEVQGMAPLPMQPGPDGVFETEARCGPGARYRYRVAPGLAVPDPASRLQDGDVHDASIVVDDAHPWRHPDWRGRPWHETVACEAHPGLLGGYSGIERRLPQWARLGVTAVQLMPVADFAGERNWGYDGVLPYAPERRYGSPEALRRMIDTAHGLGMMVFLDVVYNHFGPEGNYLPRYAPEFFRSDRDTPWGAAIDFRRPQVRRFFAENALYWLSAYRFDGLRLDAVHAISEPGWLPEMARFVRSALEPGRHIHLMLENDDNDAALLEQGFDAQWNDDGHHVLHHLLTGESQGYYADYADRPAQRLARCLAEGYAYQGEASASREGRRRGSPSAHLPPTAFMLFLQNHDQVGNRAQGERLVSLCGDGPALRAAVALQLLAPQIPLLFMGEEWGAREPFLYFTGYRDADLAAAVREGRRREFAAFADYARPAQQAAIPDPNAPATWRRCLLPGAPPDARARNWLAYYRGLLALRRREIVPRLPGARATGARAVGPAAARACWRLGDGSRLSLHVNLGPQACPCDPLAVPDAEPLFETPSGAGRALAAGTLPAACLVAMLEDAT